MEKETRFLVPGVCAIGGWWQETGFLRSPGSPPVSLKAYFAVIHSGNSSAGEGDRGEG
ncbi:MAG: hypothetical protein AB4352_09615 [Hormoscilla sp.]